MKRIYFVASLAALSAACAASACSSKDDNSNSSGAGTSGTGDTSSGGDKTGAAGDAAGGTKSGTNGGAPAEGGTPGEGGSASGTGGSAAGAGGAATGATPIASCSTGTLFEGDPNFDGDPTDIGMSKDGQGLFDDPPLRAEALAFVDKSFFIETETEIWGSDLSVAKPKLSHIAGTEAEGDQAFLEAGKPCADTHFLVIRDMVAKANGKLAVVDYIGNSVVEISDPGSAKCKSEYVAGTHVKSADPGPDYPVLPGDVDGPGATAMFGNADNHGSVFRITTDADNNLYVWDNGNNKFKMIANESDADRTVTTVGVGSDGDNLMGLTYLKGKLYATGVDGSNDFLLEIDPAAYNSKKPTANVKEIFRERNHFPDDVESSHQAVLTQLTNDGEALIVTGQSGFIWRVGTDGKVLATLAGSGTYLGYDADFDPTKSHPAKDWQLPYAINSNGGPWLAVNGSTLYWSGTYGVGENVIGFDCK